MIENQGSPQDLIRNGVDFPAAPEIGNSETPAEIEATETCPTISTVTEKLNSTDEIKLITRQHQSLYNFKKMEASSKGQVEGNMFVNYARAGGNACGLIFVGLLFLLAQILASAADYWVSFWASEEEMRMYQGKHESVATCKLPNGCYDGAALAANERRFTFTTDQCIWIHGGLMMLVFTVALIRSVGFFKICITASQTMHNWMFEGLISSIMRFFDTNPSGRILNRFSKDMGSVDELLPKAILDATQIILSLTGAVLVACIVNPLFLVPIALTFFIFLFVRRVYLKTSKDLKRLEGISMLFSILHGTQLTNCFFRSITGVFTFVRYYARPANDSCIQRSNRIGRGI